MPAPATPALALLRRWVVDYFNRHDAAACAAFIAPDYALNIGDVVFAGRDDVWLPAVDKQMKLFPGLTMTVHQTLSGEDWAAAWFSEHGVSDNRAACWSGVAIYRTDGQVLRSCVAQEDYMTRHRQMKTGIADAVDPPAAAPWDTPQLPRDQVAEDAVAAWLTGDWPQDNPLVRCDDEYITNTPLHFRTETVEIETLYSSGPDVVFHAVQTGTYQGGFAKVEGVGQPAHLHCNGILHVRDSGVHSGRIIRDRTGLQATLRHGGAK